MKKIIIILAIVITIFSFNKMVVIPKDAIRFRVIASSNSKEDQDLKRVVVNNLTSKINFSSLASTNIDVARKNIKEAIPMFKEVIDNTLEEEDASINYTINYGENHFPRKEYKNVYYEEGNYESLVVTLGDGKGKNFWCVLFPPLCLIEKDNKNSKDVEYKSFIKEIIDKYF